MSQHQCKTTVRDGMGKAGGPGASPGSGDLHRHSDSGNQDRGREHTGQMPRDHSMVRSINLLPQDQGHSVASSARALGPDMGVDEPY